MTKYASLHNHDYYSLMDGYSSPAEMLERCVEVGVSAFATTNHGHLYSYVYYDSLLNEMKKKYPEKYGGLKLIFGNEMYECEDINIKDSNNRYYHLVVLIRDDEGRKLMNELTTKSNFEGMYYKPRVDLSMFKGIGEHFVVSSACLASKLSHTEDDEQCIQYIKEYKEIFPYFYLEMQSHDNEGQVRYNQKILRLSHATNTPCIITTDSHYAREEDSQAQAYWVAVGRKQKGSNAKDTQEMSEVYDGCYIQSAEEIHAIMDKQIGIEAVNQCLANTLTIADLCEEIHMPFQVPQLPPFDVPSSFKNEDEYLWYQIKQGWEYRGFDKLGEEVKKEYIARVKEEYGVISSMGFSGYFLHEKSMTDYAHETKMALGAGRGSAAGSLVCYLLRITNLDPVKYGLIFSRFLNVERISLPKLLGRLL